MGSAPVLSQMSGFGTHRQRADCTQLGEGHPTRLEPGEVFRTGDGSAELQRLPSEPETILHARFKQVC